jgi:Rad3-related DNA helicase
MFYQIDENAFIGYVNTLKERGKMITKVGVQSLDIAPAVHELVAAGAKLIFMSGTLNTEMFNFRLKLDAIECNTYEYSFEERRIQLYILGKGSNNEKLTTSFHSRNNDVQGEYGKTIYDLITHIPEGKLIFFPSYDYKQASIEHWLEIDLLKEENGHYYFEMEDGRKIQLFNDMIGSEAIENFKDYVKENEAVLCSVYRSRASEGEDYTNIKGVFVLGIPFANIKDAGITLKMEYYNKLKTGYGSAWYNSDAIDAVNQACGRGMRKERDYCSIFLMDNRYAQGTYFNCISHWIREGLVKNPPIKDHVPENIVRSLQSFYTKNKKINQLRRLE